MQDKINILKDKIEALLRQKNHLLIAIDGRCASGKTTLASKLGEIYDCNIIHMDDFFLRPEQRTNERLMTPGENTDHERFLAEALIPLHENRPFSYQPYNCKEGKLANPISVFPKAINIIEGSYSCHPSLSELYDLRLFLTVSPDEQLRRIEKRNGSENVEVFKSKWIPLEEMYFSAFDIKDRCDYCFST